MAEPDPNDGQQTEPTDIPGLRNHNKTLEKATKELQRQLDEMTAKTAEYESKLATFTKAAIFDKLGIPSTGAGKMFRDFYAGDLTEEAVSQAAQGYELVKPNQPTAPVDQGAMARMDAALTGSQPAAASTLQAIAEADTSAKLQEVLASLGLTDSGGMIAR